MTPVDFLNDFGAVANAPGGVQRLREMILQLAVQGKLVEQNPDDEPASELLEKIAFEKAELIKNGEIKKQELLQKIIPKNTAYLVPSNWIWCSFGSIWELISGRDLSTSQYHDSQNGVPYITGASNINNSRLIVNRWTECPTVVSKVDDLLISCKGTIGKTVFNTIGNSHIARQIMAIRGFTGNLNRFFLKIWLDGFVFKLVEKSKSMIPGFSREDLLTASFPLPPLEEQKRIVAKVDQLMALCDQLEAQQQKRSKLVKHARISALEALANAQRGEELQTAWKRVEENLPTLFESPEDVEDLKKCILQNAVMGKLVSQNPDDEPASELLKKIAKEKAELIKKGEIKRQNPLPEIRDDEKPFEIPAGWKWCRLSDTLIDFIGGFAYKSERFKSNTNYQVLRLGNVKNDHLKLDSNPVYIDEDYANDTKPFELKIDDVLITMTGTRAKRDYCFTTVLKEKDFKSSNLYLNQRVGCFRFSSWCDVEYLNLMLKVDLLLNQIFEKATGTANQANVGKGSIVETVFPLPPIAEQKRIVEKTQSLLSLCYTLQKQLAKSRKVAEQLAQSVVESITGISTEKMVNDLIAEKPGQV